MTLKENDAKMNAIEANVIRTKSYEQILIE